VSQRFLSRTSFEMTRYENCHFDPDSSGEKSFVPLASQRYLSAWGGSIWQWNDSEWQEAGYCHFERREKSSYLEKSIRYLSASGAVDFSYRYSWLDTWFLLYPLNFVLWTSILNTRVSWTNENTRGNKQQSE